MIPLSNVAGKLDTTQEDILKKLDELPSFQINPKNVHGGVLVNTENIDDYGMSMCDFFSAKLRTVSSVGNSLIDFMCSKLPPLRNCIIRNSGLISLNEIPLYKKPSRLIHVQFPIQSYIAIL